MQIRNYLPGDEVMQARVYNEAAGKLPAFKPANAEEIARRYRTSDADPASKFYAVVEGEVVGYCVFNPNGRVSYPWCVSHAAEVQPQLMDAVLDGLRRRGGREAWVTYRSDWTTILDFFLQNGFSTVGELINYVGEVARLPKLEPPADFALAPLARDDIMATWQLGRGIFEEEPEQLENFYFTNPYFDPASVFTLKRVGDGQLLGVGLAICNPKYADPTKLDAAMPCFRLGAMGTEAERHKRVNGMFSCVFRSENAGEILLAEAARRFVQAGLTHAATQAASDHPALISFYQRYFTRQGAFPILARELSPTSA
jgi:L-amino acid N-acyltransferase YncA